MSITKKTKENVSVCYDNVCFNASGEIGKFLAIGALVLILLSITNKNK